MQDEPRTLEEDDEDGLDDLVPGVRVLEGVLDVRDPEEHVATTGPPQHLLEGRQALAQNDTGDEPQLETTACTTLVLITE